MQQLGPFHLGAAIAALAVVAAVAAFAACTRLGRAATGMFPVREVIVQMGIGFITLASITYDIDSISTLLKISFIFLVMLATTYRLYKHKAEFAVGDIAEL